MQPEPTTHMEYRVTGEPGTHRYGGIEHRWPPYEFVWSTRKGHADPEAQAREFMAAIRTRDNWEDGPHLHSRLVIETPWEPVE